MDQADFQRLRKNRVALMDIEPSQILDHLIQEGVFSPDMVEEITLQTTARNQTGKMLNMLEKRGPSAYGKFRQVLQTIPVYKYLVVKLDSTNITGVEHVLAEHPSDSDLGSLNVDNLLDDREEEDEQAIEVTGFKPTTDDEMLKLYFENPRKSGGGEIKTLEKDCKTGAIRITFKDPSVAGAVSKRTHKVSGASLTVKLITKKKPRPRPVKKQCLFLKGIPDGCSSERLTLFVDSLVDMDEELKIQYGEMPGTAICTFSCDIPDLEKVIKKISSKKLLNETVTAEVVHETDFILVQGLSQKSSLEMVELYFENKKKSGGSGVREILPGPMDGQAIVYFEDWKVVIDVLKKGPHKLSGVDLSVEAYYYCLGRLSMVDAPTPHIPKRVHRIQSLFTRMQKEEKIEHLSKEVEWKYSTPVGMKSYDAEINAMLEDAFQKKIPFVRLDLEEGCVTIDIAQMQEKTRSTGSIVNVHRIDLRKAATFEMPSNWIPMKTGELFQLTTLTAGSPEYSSVETKFRASIGAINQIHEIQRIQNQELLMQYQARKAALEARLGRTNNIEETLFHGTDEQTCSKINRQGFNRSFCGKNATAYGNGTYFAVQASYLASPQYAKPNAAGIKHVYLTNVLVGDHIRGSQGMVTPPNKPQSPGELFDSVVDNVNQPGIYVIFHDAQAYPEYLIKFQ